MIVQLAGTSGSGKTYAVRRFMEWVEDQEDSSFHVCEGSPPIGYDLRVGKRWIHLVGPYEKADTAGCDTIRDIEKLYRLIRTAHANGDDVLFEGLFMMNMTRGPVLVEEVGAANMRIIQLTAPLSQCVASINKRRASRGEGPLHSKKNTAGNFVRAENYCLAMKRVGVRILRASRGEELTKLRDALEL